ncbi:MAG: hypothetical protein JSR58_00595 [Verrucomicrobia bacterium]|nr:hypothetical protein [Verrucomicrobiota bacterium]
MQKWKNFCSIAAILATGVVTADQMSASGSNKNMPMDMNRGHEVSADQMGAGYNQYAEYDLGSNWDWFIQASFIYWHVSQGAMDIDLSTQRFSDGTTSAFANPGHIDFQNFKYKPGFKVAMGFDSQFDNWVPFAEYTWLHHTTKMNKTADENQALVLGSWVPAKNNSAQSLSSEWKFDLDILDFAISRPYYQGTRLTVNPVVGLRAMWLKQTNELEFTPFSTQNDPAFTKRAETKYENKSWALGPRLGFYSSWHLGAGFRAIGNAFASILYTRYNKVELKSDQVDTASSNLLHVSPVHIRTSRINTLRPQVEMNLGLGWGEYIFGHDYHIDFSATYDFMVFWNQNMNRALSLRTGGGGAFGDLGDLYIHGLTLTGRFDF